MLFSDGIRLWRPGVVLPDPRRMALRLPVIHFLLAALLLMWLVQGQIASASEQATPDAPAPVRVIPAMRDTLFFGQSASLVGADGAVGRAMRTGIRAAFREANQRGGVKGKNLSLISLDDGDDPEQTMANTRALIQNRDVFAMVGVVGAETSRAAQPIAEAAGVPYLAPLADVEVLRELARRPNLVTVRATIHQEMGEIVRRLDTELRPRRIGVLYRDDTVGRIGLDGLLEALQAHGREAVIIVDYPGNTEAVKLPLLDLRRYQPDVVVVIGASGPVAALVRWARRLNFRPVFVNVSYVGAEALARKLGWRGAGVYITQVMPFATDTSLPLIVDYQAALAATAPEALPDSVSLEGYVAGRLIVSGLRLAKPPITRRGFMRALRNAGGIDLGGFVLTYGVGDNRGSDAVYLARIDDRGRLRPATRLVR